MILAGIITGPVVFGETTTIKVAQNSGTPVCETTDAGCYIPKKAQVSLGSTVIFSNTDSTAHTFTSDTSANGPSGQFDSGLVMAGATYQITVKDWGTINYFCMVHPWMKGVLVVGNSIIKSDDNPKSMY